MIESLKAKQLKEEIVNSHFAWLDGDQKIRRVKRIEAAQNRDLKTTLVRPKSPECAPEIASPAEIKVIKMQKLKKETLDSERLDEVESISNYLDSRKQLPGSPKQSSSFLLPS